MEVELYGDVFVLLNGSMDFLILWLTAVIAKRKIPLWRFFVGSILMAICPLLGIVIPKLHPLYSPLGSFVILSVGVWLVFLPRQCKDFLSLILIAYIASFTVGGCGLALFFVCGAPPIFGGNVVYQSRLYPAKLLIVLMAFFYIVIKLCHGLLEGKVVNRKNYCTAMIRHNGKEAVLNALIDTGNGLIDPFSGYPVLIGTFDALQQFFSKDSREKFFEGKCCESEMQEYLLLHETALASRLVPYSSLGQSNGLLLVFRPTAIRLLHGNGEFLITKVVVGVYMGVFQGGYEALVSPSFFKEEQEIKSIWVKGEQNERL